MAKYLLIVGAFSFYTATYGQIKPTNAKEYDVAVFFLQSFGTIGSDGAGNPPDPAWQMAVASDTEGDINSLLNNNPNVNNNTYYYWLTTDVNDWHPVQDGLFEIVYGNRNGTLDYEIMSYENDCVSQGIYNVGGGCTDNDDNMLYK